MTGQMSNTIEYEDEVFDISAVEGQGMFEPEQYGMRPIWCCTACYAGFLTHYQVKNRILYLQNLSVCLTEAGKGPDQKIPAPEIEGHEAIVVSNELDPFEYRYEDMNLWKPFTGNLLIATDFIHELYEHIGYQAVWKYRKVKDLQFEEEKLVESTDLSDFMEEYRNVKE